VPSGKNARTTAPAKEGVPYGISGASYWLPVTIPLSVTYCHARAGMPPLHLRITHHSSPSLIAAEVESGGTHGAAAMSRSDGTVAYPLVDAQKQRSRAESGSATEPLVAMHMRSEAASAVEKAQQQPAAPHCANAIRQAKGERARLRGTAVALIADVIDQHRCRTGPAPSKGRRWLLANEERRIGKSTALWPLLG
jgi:hypothetical protein